jgi:hypothetical protein
MRFKSITLGLLLLAAAGAQAQKVDLDRYNFQGSYRILPKYPLGPDFTTQKISINASSSVRDGVSEGEMANSINIEGFKKITEKAHINVDIYMDDLMIEAADVAERVEEVKDKDGKVTGKNYYYRATATYSFSARATASDYKGNNLANWTLAARGDKKSWQSNEYSSRNAAAEYFNNNKYAIRNQLTKEQAMGALGNLNSALNGNYGYVSNREADILWMLDSKKHPENDAQKAAWASFKEAIGQITPDEIPQAAKDKMLELTKYFDSVKVKYAGTEKGDKKMRYSSFYNNAKIYLYLDMPELAIKEAEGLMANEYDEKDGKWLKADAEKMIKAFKTNNTTTRHFKIDLSKAEAPKINP